MATEAASDEAAEIGANVLVPGSVDGDVVADRVGNLAGNDAQPVFTENVGGTVVIIYGTLVLGEPETLTPTLASGISRASSIRASMIWPVSKAGVKW